MKRGRDIDELITNVEACYNNYDPRVLNRVWFSHQTVLDSIINHHGDNCFDIAHVQKDVLERNGFLPHHFGVSDGARAVLEEHRLI